MSKLALHLLSLLFLLGCEQREIKPINMDDLRTLKGEFLQQIYASDVEEGPFNFNYTFRTVFFSKEVVSLFGEINVHDRLPHGWQYYEGKTFCTIDNNRKEVTLQGLFPNTSQKEYLRQICEDSLKQEPTSYFGGKEPFHSSLGIDDIHTFVVDEKNLIIIFQPYRVGGGADGPFVIKIPFTSLKGHWNESHPLHSLMKKAIESYNFTSSWDSDEKSGRQLCQIPNF
jgi:hypothetical protein